MKQPVAIIGIGEVGGVFARGFLRSGRPVYPVTRDTDWGVTQQALNSPALTVVAVGEKDFGNVLDNLPESWDDRVVLLQNELLPQDWKKHGIQNPTVISVWFEKKQPYDFKVIIPSPVYGPHADMVKDALESIDIPCRILENEDDLLFELVLKNLYILTSNIAGLKVGGTVGSLWKEHSDLARAVADDVLDIQFRLIGKDLDREKLMEAMVKAFEGDPDHKCTGRSAPARLERALKQAEENGLDAETLKEIQSTASVS